MSFSSASGRENNVRKLSFLGFNTKKKVSDNYVKLYNLIMELKEKKIREKEDSQLFIC